ncbi:DUF1266 domain-containing protein [Maribacter dokdonensis]|uniref:DUF1266 domain-containing protein n=1 Tax=Maribacter dokdonensis TaxID=320912 RepID=UPI003296C8F5
MTAEITPKIQDQLNLSALVLMNNYKKADLNTWYGFDIEDHLQLKNVERIAKLHGIQSGVHLRNSLHRYETGAMASNPFEKLASEFRNYTTNTYETKYNAQKNPMTKNVYKLVWRYRFSLKNEKLQGYDFAYYIFLMRIGGALGFIKPEEIAMRLEDVNTRLKNTFSSWGEFHRNVCIGDEFIRGAAEPDISKYPGTETLWECYQRLHIHQANSFKEWNK